ncbi:MAG TPA: glycosyltransferase, partial [Candidatus Binataceae bacterium]|nr:glycosyltransferase [Candidatus Binataceae bacterium]
MPEQTGVDRSMTQLVRHLAKIDRANYYRIFLNREDRDVFAAMLPDNFSIATLSLRPRMVRGFFQQIVLPLVARRWDAAVVHSPAFIMPMYRGSQRHVLTIHDLTSFSLPQYHIPLRRSALYKSAVRASIRRADVMIAPSNATKRSILKLVPTLPTERVRVVPWGIGSAFKLYPQSKIEEASKRLGLPPRYILFVGTIEPRKNLPLLVESYR